MVKVKDNKEMSEIIDREKTDPDYIRMIAQIEAHAEELKEDKGIDIKYQRTQIRNTDTDETEILYTLIKVGPNPYMIHRINFRSLEDCLYGIHIIGSYLTLDENDGYCVDFNIDHMVGKPRIT